MQDEYWLRQALHLAQIAADQGEVPIGALVVRDDEIIGKGYNQPIQSCDPTAHAEIIALRDAALNVGNYRLPGATLYCTLEPCAMCAGAMLHARIERLVFAASDPKGGAVVSVVKLLDETRFNHHITYQCGTLSEESVQLLQQFFKARR